MKVFSMSMKEWERILEQFSLWLIKRIVTGSIYANSQSLRLLILKKSSLASITWLKILKVIISSCWFLHFKMLEGSFICPRRQLTSKIRIIQFRFTFLLNKLENVVKQKSFPLLTTSRLINIMTLIKPVCETEPKVEVQLT